MSSLHHRINLARNVMGVRNWSLTEGDGKEHLSSSRSSVCRSSWPWFCMICPVGCLNIAGVIDSWRRMATAGYFFAVNRTALSSGELDIRNPPKFFRRCLVCFWLFWDGLAHGRIWTWSLNSTAQREPSLRWDLDGISLCGDSACTHACTPRTCRRAIHFWQVVLPKQTDAIDLSLNREK